MLVVSDLYYIYYNTDVLKILLRPVIVNPIWNNVPALSVIDLDMTSVTLVIEMVEIVVIMPSVTEVCVP
jgi:hypothetical protein